MTTIQSSANTASSHPDDVARSAFVTTRWSVVLAASGSDTSKAQRSLEQLCQTYWRPLYAFVRRRGYSPADAEDLTQEFFAWVLERNWLEAADQTRGRFRSFLLTSLSRFLANEWDKRRAQKRGGGRVFSLAFDEADQHWEPADTVTPEQYFERRWAVTLLDQVMNRLSAEYQEQGKADLFAQVKPCLLGEKTAQPYAALAARLGITEGSLKVIVHRLRQRYRQLLREEIANTVARPEEIEDEMRHLFSVLAQR